MGCEEIRTALSAALDGEDSPVRSDALERHLEECAACRAWRDGVAAIAGARRPEPADDALPAVLAALAAERSAADERAEHRRLLPARVGLVTIALSHPFLAVHLALDGHEHEARELAALHLALAIGFLFVAVRPARAWGMLPLVAALVGGLLATAGMDLSDGHTTVGNELVHILDVAGVWLLWVVSRRPGRAVVATAA